MKKGQYFDGPIIYFFVAIVLFVAVYFGVKYVSNSVDYSEDISIQEFVTAFNVKVQKAYYSNPDIKISLEPVRVPPQVIEVCFVDFNKDLDFSNVNTLEFRGLLENITLDNESNFFVFGDFKSEKIYSFKLENVVARDDLNPVCDLNNEGKVRFKAISTNKKVELIIE